MAALQMARQVVVRGVACVLIHTPGLVRHGSKPSRELSRGGAEAPLLATMQEHLRSYTQAVAYPPNQAVIGNIAPEALFDIPRPWWCADTSGQAKAMGPFGEIMAEEAFWGLLRLADDFELVHLAERVATDASARLSRHPLFGNADLDKLTHGEPQEVVAEHACRPGNMALHDGSGQLVGYVVSWHPGDASQSAGILLEH